MKQETLSPRRAISRRRFLHGLASVGTTAFIAACGAGYAFELEPRWLELVSVDIPLNALPNPFHGLRVVQLSDLHRGPTTGLAEIARAVRLAQAQAPDLFVLTGDYVTGNASYAADLTAVLSELQAPLGVFAVLGNHDHWTDATVVGQHLRAAGIQLLVNETMPLIRQKEVLWLAGVDDVWVGRADLAQTLARVPQAGSVLLLAHEPDYADTAASDPRIKLQLSGHSHGGQVRVPGLGAPVLPSWGQKYPIGLNRVDGLTLYTNRGVGTTPLGPRLNCRPEVTLITLLAAD